MGLALLGAAVAWLGIGVRAWAITTLGRFFGAT